ncbi:hypothetical protein [Flavobacterium sharifuzzamanii]|uniref:hypothetical protein n=1 Tax=Flavobacterium sharifuzzamanii TaxID=2211133 RepID=UPI000DAE317E|nr:hypothetical protein [Flavobacterium sharifuzzamanii]KAF2082855.1 hypothetical protein DMA14_01620 [Flavobacterium sharifuzzamanii]
MELRKIKIEDNLYLYKMLGKINSEASTGILSIKVFLNGWKQSPLQIDFVTWDDSLIGYPLNTGFPLLNSFTGEKDIINLNRPKYIKECVLYGLKNGWDGKNKVQILDGLKMLEDLGYDISVLIPEK